MPHGGNARTIHACHCGAPLKKEQAAEDATKKKALLENAHSSRDIEVLCRVHARGIHVQSACDYYKESGEFQLLIDYHLRHLGDLSDGILDSNLGDAHHGDQVWHHEQRIA